MLFITSLFFKADALPLLPRPEEGRGQQGNGSVPGGHGAAAGELDGPGAGAPPAHCVGQ